MVQTLQIVSTVILVLVAIGGVMLLARLWFVVKRLEKRGEKFARLGESRPAD